MIYKIRYTAKAIDDLRQVGEDVFEASKSRSITLKYLEDIFDAIEKKQLFPRSGSRILSSEPLTDIYYVHFKAYNAFYRIVEDRMEVIRVLPSKSDYIRVLLGDYYEEDTDSSNEEEYLNETTSV